MLKSDLWIFGVISLIGAALFGIATWALVVALRRTESVTVRILIGIVLAVCGLLALACSACGLMIVGS